ncbi:MAG: UDP-N-acetylglucosamine 2-epimerase (non-hydrolyzing) [Rhodobiaceae bacterium]|nr:UDP-N-acetylglucosamine 2-epimerase (non-hydrolyzing) [Rhodobiaceae bacterium]MCC0015031.1 UDP-N-acetylglucosamine 2-epimerase (non-hydrolyzing) [Rhodobiaceae bacterium]MCC0052961.1 UDP-N-acetylglucosamine 2-epimerase (non-hydrolyzing) [Rhodobiaceae bacterium]
MKVLLTFGTRPEAIKMAPIIHEFARTIGVDARVCVTGQHKTMLDEVLKSFRIEPDYDLEVMTANQSLNEVFVRIVQRLDPVIGEFAPDVVLVQGDTTTSWAAAMAAFYRGVPVGHVEAGLRTGDLFSPWPEEANRRMTSVVATRHYAPTHTARKALLDEGHMPDTVKVTGNTVIDALLMVHERVTQDPTTRQALEQRFSWLAGNRKLILVTGHRRESFGAGFERMCSAIKAIAARDDVQVCYPVHLNPNVQEPVHRHLGNLDNVALIEPLDYEAFVFLMDRAHLILTDSGGVQEEAPSLGKPVLVMRETSERMEGVDAGVARLVTTDPRLIEAHVTELLDNPERYAAMATGKNPYGDGLASRRIVKDLLSWHRTRTASASSASAMSGSLPQPSSRLVGSA